MDKQVILAVGLAGLATAAVAHHGTSTFDHSQELEITGVASDIAFVNPHSYVYLDVPDEAGNIAVWRCEMRAATALRRSGWTEEMFRSGRPLTIVGAPSREEAHTCYVNTIEFADGSTADRYSQLVEAAARSVPADRSERRANGVPNIAGDWAAEQRVMADPRGREGGLVPLGVARQGAAEGRPPRPNGPPPGPRLGVEPTDAGRQASAGYDPQTDNPRFQCQPTNIFMDWVFDQHVNQIVQSDSTITLKYGFMDLERTIHLDMAEHPADLTPSKAGHSIGHWDGDVLVVDTIGFEPGFLDGRRGFMYSDQMHVVERWTYDHSAGTLSRSWVAEDPLYFTGQYTNQDVVSIADIPYEPYNCDDRTWQDSEFAELESETEPAQQDTSKPWWQFW